MSELQDTERSPIPGTSAQEAAAMSEQVDMEAVKRNVAYAEFLKSEKRTVEYSMVVEAVAGYVPTLLARLAAANDSVAKARGIAQEAMDAMADPQTNQYGGYFQAIGAALDKADAAKALEGQR